MPVGVTNSLQLLPGNLPYRMASNNYYIGHARVLAMMALSIDPADDPPLNASLPGSTLGNTLRSYILNATGAWLYQQYAMMGDATTVVNGYGIGGNGAGFGLASGGLPPEGMLYGESFGFALGELLALQTAGFNNVAYSGPQINLIGAPVWDRWVTGIISSLTPTAQVFSSASYLGPLYQYGSYGDILRLWVTPDYMRPFSLLAMMDEETGVTTHINAARWFVVNAAQGGPGFLMSRITDPWSFTETILYYMLLDPAAAAGTDPRPTYPAIFYDPGAGRIFAHSDWTSHNTMFDYRASWESINHQDGDGGQFEFFRKGEWLTKEMSNYDNNAVGLTSVYHNTLSLQNYCANGTPSNLQWDEGGEWANGGQWILGSNNGDPSTVMSSGPGYIYAASSLTNLYNRPDFWSPPDAAMSITQVTRSIVWLNNDYIVVYDRATSQNTGLFKQFQSEPGNQSDHCRQRIHRNHGGWAAVVHPDLAALERQHRFGIRGRESESHRAVGADPVYLHRGRSHAAYRYAFPARAAGRRSGGGDGTRHLPSEHEWHGLRRGRVRQLRGIFPAERQRRIYGRGFCRPFRRAYDAGDRIEPQHRLRLQRPACRQRQHCHSQSEWRERHDG